MVPIPGRMRLARRQVWLLCLLKWKQVETVGSNRGQDRTVFGEKCKLSFQFRGFLACSPGARLRPLGHLSRKT